ncbi:rhoptry kinase family protein ROP23 (incomplete catalytic triad) [Besnoitia besnoiti]|uniref:Rhoptry kinase family protein ROP23 (Incomplete catalytic triad) n=1 Tax=Besnoitia besnoiti TaxID=94643 RepID=A0A2A9M779_BESBE|nr:rhoptry kinase family protein ROP23 (incomplete catalytic triad) [Besnoitia besnoiti]PFH33044.1 rhoptry kinase family protein ROP23 (incomplete catalytic triad) [Besnoitia besnoiti]
MRAIPWWTAALYAAFQPNGLLVHADSGKIENTVEPVASLDFSHSYVKRSSAAMPQPGETTVSFADKDVSREGRSSGPGETDDPEQETQPFSTKTDRDHPPSRPPEPHAFSPLGAVFHEPRVHLERIYEKLGGQVKARDPVQELMQRLAKDVFPLFRRLKFWGNPPTVFSEQSGGEAAPGREAVALVVQEMDGRTMPMYEDWRRQLVYQTIMRILQQRSPLLMNSISGNREVVFTIEGYVPVAGWGVCVRVAHPETNQKFVLIDFVSFGDSTWGHGLEEKLRETARPLRTLGLTDPRQAYLLDRLMLPLDLLEIPKASRYFFSNEFVIPNLFVLMPRPASTLEQLLSFLSAMRDLQTAFAARLSLTIQVIQVVAGLHNRGIIYGDLHPNSFLVSSNGAVFLGLFCRVRAARKNSRCMKHVPTGATGCDQEKAGVRDNKTDAWALGAVLYYIWCDIFPSGLLGGEQLSSDALRKNFLLEFTGCASSMPDAAKVLIGQMLDSRSSTRLTATEILREASFGHLQGLLSALSTSVATSRTERRSQRDRTNMRALRRRRRRLHPYNGHLFDS